VIHPRIHLVFDSVRRWGSGRCSVGVVVGLVVGLVVGIVVGVVVGVGVGVVVDVVAGVVPDVVNNDLAVDVLKVLLLTIVEIVEGMHDVDYQLIQVPAASSLTLSYLAS
jgi:hypothetical protein